MISVLLHASDPRQTHPLTQSDLSQELIASLMVRWGGGQCCNCSHLIFMIVIALLSVMIANSFTEGVHNVGKHNVRQFADDTALFF